MGRARRPHVTRAAPAPRVHGCDSVVRRTAGDFRDSPELRVLIGEASGGEDQGVRRRQGRSGRTSTPILSGAARSGGGRTSRKDGVRLERRLALGGPLNHPPPLHPPSWLAARTAAWTPAAGLGADEANAATDQLAATMFTPVSARSVSRTPRPCASIGRGRDRRAQNRCASGGSLWGAASRSTRPSR